MRCLAKSVLVPALCLIWAMPLRAGSELEIRPAEYDFGYIPQQCKVSHTFWLHATGDEEVKITSVNPGCGCTQAPLEKDVVAPGDSARLEIIFNSQRYISRVMKKPIVQVQGRPEPYLVTITAYVEQRADSTYPLRLKPYKLDISQYGETVRDRGLVAITNVSGEDLDVTLVCGLGEFGELNLPDQIKAGETVEIELVLAESVLEESFEKSFTIELSDEHKSRYTIPVRRVVRDPRASQLTAPGGSR